MLTLDQARSLLADRVQGLPPVELDLADALGHNIALPPISDTAAPPNDVSAMDGYAARKSDLEAERRFKEAFVITAGSVPKKLPPGEVARIFTGALLPEGADIVIQQELAEIDQNGDVNFEEVPAVLHVRRGGEVMTPGSQLASVGDVVTPQRIAVLAAGGAHRVTVFPRPRVAVLITGSELVPANTLPGPGQIRNSNGPLLDGLVRMAGCQAPCEYSAGDEEVVLTHAMGKALENADVVLTSGGVSVGDYDLVPDVVRSLGGEVVFHRVAVKPGKPILAARIGPTWVIGLPGNPVSVLAGWRMFALPVVNGLGGMMDAFSETPRFGVLTRQVVIKGAREELRPANLSIDGKLHLVPWKGSHDLLAASGADALARFQPGRRYTAGEEVPCYPI